MVTAHKDEYGRDYYIDPNTGKRISKAEAYVQAGTVVGAGGRAVDIGDTGKRTGTGFFGIDQGLTKQGAGTTYQRALVREEAGIEPTEEMKGKGWSSARKKYAKARRADRRLKRTKERAASRAKQGKSDTSNRERIRRLEAQAGTIATGAGGKMTADDYQRAHYFEAVNKDREDTAAKKAAEVFTIAVTAGAAGAYGGGAAVTTEAAVGAGATGATAATGTAAAGTAAAGTGSMATMGSIAPTAISTGVAPATSGGLITSGTSITGSAMGVTGGTTASGLASTTAVAAPASTGALTLGEKIIKGGQQAKEYYDKAKPYIDTAKTIAGAFGAGGGDPSGAGRGSPQVQPPAYAVGQPSMGYGGYGGAPQQPLTIGGDPSMAGMSSGMSDQQMQSIAGALGAGAEDNYDLSTFVNQSDLQTLYAERGGRIKQKIDYPEQILKHGGRIKTV